MYGGRGVSSILFLLESSLFREQERLFIQNSKPPMSAGFWEKGDGKDAEESPGGYIISSVVSNECVFRQAADGWHLLERSVSIS